MLIARSSKLKLFGLFGATLIFVWIGIWMGTSGETIFHRGFGWLCAAFFGLGLFVFPHQLMSGGREVSISSDGVSDSAWKIGIIAWSEVTAVWLSSSSGNDLVCFALRQSDLILNPLSATALKLATVNRSLGFGDFQVAAVGLDKSAAELLQEISKYISILPPIRLS